jgi:cysteine desulfurase
MSRIYLDYNASAPIDKQVALALRDFLNHQVALNPSSIHSDGRKARTILEEARKNILASVTNNINQYRLVFMSSGSEANNMLVNSFQDIAFITSETEHVSILECAHSNRFLIEVEENGTVNPKTLENLLAQINGKKIVSIMLANNETGVINDIKQLCNITHKNGGLFHCDASQAYGKIKLDLENLNVDFITLSSHKAGGPTGAAALIARNDIELTPLIKGGKQEIGLRAGTENLLAINGFANAALQINQRITKHENIAFLRNFMEQEIKKNCAHANFFGSGSERIANTSCIRMPGIKSEEQLIKFDLAGISVSAGSACSSGRISASHVLKAMKIDEAQANEVIRVSMGPETSKDEIEQFINIWHEIYNRR